MIGPEAYSADVPLDRSVQLFTLHEKLVTKEHDLINVFMGYQYVPQSANPGHATGSVLKFRFDYKTSMIFLQR